MRARVVDALTFVGSQMLLKIVDFSTPISVYENEEKEGSDENQNGEEVYA